MSRKNRPVKASVESPTSQAPVKAKAELTGGEPRRLNTRALILMTLILGVSVPGVVLLRYWQTTSQRSSLYKQAKLFKEQKDLGRALTYVNRYLEQMPGSADARGRYVRGCEGLAAGPV